MKMKNLFSIPEGKKITEKYLHRMLISSICSILLCMSCLAGTTWALFAVTIENGNNVIEIAEKPQAAMKVDGRDFESGTELTPGYHRLIVKHGVEQDDLQRKSLLYVTLTLTESTASSEGDTKSSPQSVCAYTLLGAEHGDYSEITIDINAACRLSWAVSWFAPDGATLVENGGTIQLTVQQQEKTDLETEKPEDGTDDEEGDSDNTNEGDPENSQNGTEGGNGSTEGGNGNTEGGSSTDGTDTTDGTEGEGSTGDNTQSVSNEDTPPAESQETTVEE